MCKRLVLSLSLSLSLLTCVLCACQVFEVNAGSVRSRGHLLGTLKEATLSHHVSLQPLVGVVNQTASERGVKLSTNPKKKKKKKEKKKGSSGILTFFKRADQRESDKERGEGRSGRPVSLESSTVILLEEVSPHSHPLRPAVR